MGKTYEVPKFGRNPEDESEQGYTAPAVAPPPAGSVPITPPTAPGAPAAPGMAAPAAPVATSFADRAMQMAAPTMAPQQATVVNPVGPTGNITPDMATAMIARNTPTTGATVAVPTAGPQMAEPYGIPLDPGARVATGQEQTPYLQSIGNAVGAILGAAVGPNSAISQGARSLYAPDAPVTPATPMPPDTSAMGGQQQGMGDRGAGGSLQYPPLNAPGTPQGGTASYGGGPEKSYTAQQLTDMAGRGVGGTPRDPVQVAGEAARTRAEFAQMQMDRQDRYDANTRSMVADSDRATAWENRRDAENEARVSGARARGNVFSGTRAEQAQERAGAIALADRAQARLHQTQDAYINAGKNTAGPATDRMAQNAAIEGQVTGARSAVQTEQGHAQGLQTKAIMNSLLESAKNAKTPMEAEQYLAAYYAASGGTPPKPEMMHAAGGSEVKEGQFYPTTQPGTIAITRYGQPNQIIAGQGAQRAAPSLEVFMESAKKANPSWSPEELKKQYAQQYGAK